MKIEEVSVMAVDDDQWVLKVLSKILHNIGIGKIVGNDNGFDCVVSAMQDRPHLIFLDINMPELNGLLTLKLLKKIPITSDIKFIMITGSTELTHFKDAVEAGASDYITKPFTADTIKEKLYKVLNIEN